MVDQPDSQSLAPLPQGSAVAHARRFSTAVGVLVGAATGALFGAIWGKVGGGKLAVRVATLAGLGGITGGMLSHATWEHDPILEPAPKQSPHTQRLNAAREAQAETTGQAL